jgi:hypothetical protein
MRTTPLVVALASCTLIACSAADTAPSNGTPPIAVDSGAPGTPALGMDASLHGRRPFPSDNPWNADVSAEPIDANSATLIASCGSSGLHPDFGTVWDGAPNGIPYVVVSGTQGKVPVSFMYASESDPGPFNFKS